MDEDERRALQLRLLDGYISLASQVTAAGEIETIRRYHTNAQFKMMIDMLVNVALHAIEHDAPLEEVEVVDGDLREQNGMKSWMDSFMQGLTGK